MIHRLCASEVLRAIDTLKMTVSERARHGAMRYQIKIDLSNV